MDERAAEAIVHALDALRWEIRAITTQRDDPPMGMGVDRDAVRAALLNSDAAMKKATEALRDSR